MNTYKKKQMNHVREPHKISSIKLPRKAAIIDNNAKHNKFDLTIPTGLLT